MPTKARPLNVLISRAATGIQTYQKEQRIAGASRISKSLSVLDFFSVLKQHAANDIGHADRLTLFMGDIFRMAFEPRMVIRREVDSHRSEFQFLPCILSCHDARRIPAQ